MLAVSLCEFKNWNSLALCVWRPHSHSLLVSVNELHSEFCDKLSGCIYLMRYSGPVPNSGFSHMGAPTQRWVRQPIILAIFSRKLHEVQKDWKGVPGHPLRFTNGRLKRWFKQSLNVLIPAWLFSETIIKAASFCLLSLAHGHVETSGGSST